MERIWSRKALPGDDATAVLLQHSSTRQQTWVARRRLALVAWAACSMHGDVQRTVQVSP